MRQEVVQGLQARLARLFGNSHVDTFSEVGGKAFAVIQYQTEGLAEVLKHLIGGDQESATEAMQAWAEGEDLQSFRAWAVGLVKGLEMNFRNHWFDRVTRNDRDKCLRWFAEAQKLIDDAARL